MTRLSDCHAQDGTSLPNGPSQLTASATTSDSSMDRRSISEKMAAQDSIPKEDDTSGRDDDGGRGYLGGRFASPAKLGPGPDSLDELARRLWSVHGIPVLSVTTVLDSLKAHEDMIQRIN